MIIMRQYNSINALKKNKVKNDYILKKKVFAKIMMDIVKFQCKDLCQSKQVLSE